ncbi:hypothetical protein [Francisella persica]|uniref:hypothetical protein n=1 Tax=Francisella persica TaxID=954 RepID=UPI000AFBA7CC
MKKTLSQTINSVNNLKCLQTDYIDLYQFHLQLDLTLWNVEHLAGQQNRQLIVDNIHEILVTCYE